jgi:membrane-associated phospholipid phosphatase
MPVELHRAVLSRNGDPDGLAWHATVTPERATTVFFCALLSAATSAQQLAHAEPAAPAVPAAVAPPALTAPSIAPPAPGAAPDDVDEAKKKAAAAALHPLVPSPANPLKPAFQLYAEVDLPLLGIGLVFAGGRLIRTQKASCAPLCPRSDLNVIDRTTAGYWSPGWQSVSNYGLIGISVGAAAVLFADEGFLPGLNDAAVVAESALSATGVATVLTLAAGRPRPFLYGEKAPLATRNGPDADLSYLSSHAAVSFAVVTSTLVTMRRLHPRSSAPWIVLGVGGAFASLVAVARVLGGMHFITDSVGGAVVGTSFGVLVPSLHGSPVAVVPVMGEGTHGLALCARF